MKTYDVSLLTKAAVRIAALIDAELAGAALTTPDWVKQAILTIALERYEKAAPWGESVAAPIVDPADVADAYRP